MRDISGAFLRYLSIERALSKNTCAAYAGDVDVFAAYCEREKKDPVRADAHFIEKYLWHLKSSLRLKPASIFRKMEALRAFYKFLIMEGKLGKDPTRNFRSPKLAAKLPRFISGKDMDKLLDYPSAGGFSGLRTAAIVELLYASGMRISELLGLRLESVNLEQGWARVFGKGGKERIVPVNGEAVAALKKYLDARQMKFGGDAAAAELFVNRNGRKLSRVQAWKDIARLGRLADAGAKLHPHIFRHTFASHLLSAGADLRSLQEMLGHASLNTTQIYTHLERSGLKTAHEKFHPDK